MPLYVPYISLADISKIVQLKTEAKRKEQQLADLEKQDQDLTAYIRQSKMGKEDSVHFWPAC